MPINELEIHPYLNDINYREYDPNYFESLIVGTFPVYGITNSLLPNGQVEERFDEQNAYMRFFYGSKKNSFWRLLTLGLGEDVNPIALPFAQRKDAAISLLTKHKFLITDVVHKTNREGELAEDKNLWVNTDNDFVSKNRSLNHGIEQILEDNKSIKYLYFTSTVLLGKSPFGWFQDIFQNRLQYNIIQQVANRHISAEVTIGDRKFTAFFLPSPAGNGTRGLHFTDNRRTQILVNFLQTLDPDFFNEIDNLPQADRTNDQKLRLTEIRKDYLGYHYHEVLQNKHVHFNGTVAEM